MTYAGVLSQAGSSRGLLLMPEDEIPRGDGEVILVAEDQTLVREVIKATLEYLNYRVVTARNGREALRVYGAHRDKIALVLTDMVMPEMGGRELIGILKQADPELQVVVMMNGYTLGDAEETALPPGVVGYLQKPVALEQLAQVLSGVFRS